MLKRAPASVIVNVPDDGTFVMTGRQLVKLVDVSTMFVLLAVVITVNRNWSPGSFIAFVNTAGVGAEDNTVTVPTIPDVKVEEWIVHR